MERLATCFDRNFSKVLKFGTLGFCFLCGLGVFKIGQVLAGSEGFRQEIPFCPAPSQDRLPVPVTSRSTILISTLDGTMSALDVASGLILWSHKTEPGPLLSSTITDYKFLSRGKSIQLIPSLDGDLYTFDGELMGGTPISAENLLSNTLKMSDDVIITGGKEIKTYGIHRKTGQILYTCGIDACKYSGPAIHDNEVLIVQRVCRTVRAVSSLTGIEKWNYSVGQHEARIVSPYTMSGGCHSSQTNEYDEETILAGVKFASAEGYVFVSNNINGKEGHWDHKFTSPIVRAWRIDGMEIQQLDVFENNYHDAFLVNESDADADASKPLIYLGSYNKQLYILQSLNVLKAMAIEWKVLGGDLRSAPPLVTWQPYLNTAISRTPVIHFKSPDDTSVVIHLKGDDKSAAFGEAMGDYPFDNGFYIIKAQSINSTPEEIVISGLSHNNDEDDSIIVSLWYWWKEIFAISITFAVLINIFITRHHIKQIRDKILNESTKQQKIVVIEAVPPAATFLQSTIESSKSNSSDASGMVTPPMEFVSRYFTDFEPIQILGKGGFGVVFKARNKMDDCDYAIKRIFMSNKNDSKERIMREVKALAKLDHVGIVRYYNSWLESPPADWRQPIEHLNDPGDIFTPSSAFTVEELHNSFALTTPDKGSAVGDTKDTWSNEDLTHLTNNNIRAKNCSYSNLGLKKHSPFDDGGAGDSLESSKFNQLDSDVSFRDSRHNMSDDSFIRFEIPKDGSSAPTFSANAKLHEFSTGSSSSSFIQFKSTTDSSAVPKTVSVERNSLPIVISAPTRPLFKSYLYIQMQLCRKDSLKDWLRCHTDERDKFETLDHFHQIVCAVDYVHDQGLMHRDLKPSNIFFAMDGAIKIGDFGLVATMSPNDEMSPNDLQENHQTTMNQKHTNQVGTRLYMSPEQIAEEAYDHKVDIFSLGLILFELLVPFSTEMERMKVMTHARERKFPSNFVEGFLDEYNLVNKMLSHSGKDRPCAAEIRQDPLLQDFQPRPSFLRHVRSRSMSMTYSTSSSTSSGNSGSGLPAGSSEVACS